MLFGREACIVARRHPKEVAMNDIDSPTGSHKVVEHCVAPTEAKMREMRAFEVIYPEVWCDPFFVSITGRQREKFDSMTTRSLPLANV